MLTPVEILRMAIKLILPNSDQKTCDAFSINFVDQLVYCGICDYEGLCDVSIISHCPKCGLELIK